MIMPIFDRLRQHVEAERRGEFAGTSIGSIAPEVTRDPLARPGIAALSALGLLMEGTQNVARAGTGGAIAGLGSLDPGAAQALPGGAGAPLLALQQLLSRTQTGRQMSSQARQGFAGSRGSFLQRLIAANEAAAQGGPEMQIGPIRTTRHAALTGLGNAALDPMNITMVGGPLAAAGGKVGKLGQLFRILDEAQGLGLNRVGGAALKRLGVATDAGLTPTARRFLADRAVGAGLGGATAATNAQFANQAIPGEENDIPLGTAALAGALGGGAVGRRNLGRGLQQVIGQAPGGMVARRAAAQGAVQAPGNISQLGIGLGVPRLPADWGDDLPRVDAAKISSFIRPELQQYFDPYRLLREGVDNLPALRFNSEVEKSWGRAKAGRLTAEDVARAYVMTVASQGRQGIPYETALGPNSRLGVLQKQPGLAAPFDRAVVGRSRSAPQGGLPLAAQQAIEQTRLIRPEDAAGVLVRESPEGRELIDALVSGDPERTRLAAQTFNSVFPFSGLSAQKGGELDRLSNAALNRSMEAVAALVNRMAQTPGATPGDIVETLRSGRLKVPGVGTGKSGFLVTLLGGGQDAVTIDSNVKNWLGDNVTPEQYTEFLRALYPLDITDATRHHLFWDTAAGAGYKFKDGNLTKVGDLTGFQTGHGGMAQGLGLGSKPAPRFTERVRGLEIDPDQIAGEQQIAGFPRMRTDLGGTQAHPADLAEIGEARQPAMSMNAGVNPEGLGRSLGALGSRLAARARDTNLARFMEGAHPLLKNADGTPKRFFHGTHSGDFDQFEVPETPGGFGHGAYFTEDSRLASIYASGAEQDFAGSDSFRPTSAGGNVKPVYVNLRNPYIWGENPQIDAQLAAFAPGGKGGIRAQLQAMGHDGVIAPKNQYFGSQGPSDAIEEMVVFDPATSVKSATGNSGAYDPQNPGLLRAGMSVDDITDALDQIRQRFAPAVSRIAGRFPQLADDRPGLSAAEREYVQQLMDFLDSDARALDDMSRLQNHAYQHWNQTLGKKADRASFVGLWESLVERIDSMKVLETGLGNAANVNRIVNSGQGVVNGFELVDMEGTGGVEGLVQRKAGAIATAGRARYLLRDLLEQQGVVENLLARAREINPKAKSVDDWFSQVYGRKAEELTAAGRKSIKANKLPVADQVDAVAREIGMDPAALQAQFDEYAQERGVRFLTNEGNAKEMLGLGNPWRYATEGTGRKPSRYVYASVTEGEAAGQKQSGTIRVIWNPDTPRVTSLTHDYMLAAPDVEDLHSAATPKSVRALWGERSVPPDRPARMPVGQTGETFTGSPLAVGPRAETAARAAMVIMSAPKDLLREWLEGNKDAALGLMLRGGQDQPSAGTMKLLGIQRAPTRTETLVLDPDLKNAQAIVIHGRSEGVIQENLAAASRLLDQFQLDIPIYVMRGPAGSPPNILPPDISPGRGEFVQRYAGQRPQFAGKPEDRLTGLQDFGAGISPGALGRMAAGLGREGAAGAALGGTAGFFADEEDRGRGALKGALGGAVGGAAFGKLAPELGRAVATAYRNHAPDLVDDTIMSPQALAIAHRNGVEAQAKGSEASGVALKDLPRQVDDAWRAQVVNTFRGLALDASSLWLLVKDFGRDFGVDRLQVKRTLGELVANHDDPDPIRRLGKLGDTIEDWGLEGFVDESTSLDQVLGTSFSRAEIGENLMSAPQRFLTGVGLSFANLRDNMLPVVGPLVGGVRQVYAPYIDSAYRTLNGFQHAAPRVAFWDAALARDLPRAADEFGAAIAPTGIDLSPLFAGGKPVRPSQVGQYLVKNYKGLTTKEVGEFEQQYAEALGVAAMQSADRIAHIFGDFRDKSAKPWKTFLGRVFPFSRYAMQFAPVGLEMAKRHPLIAGGLLAGTAASAYAVSQQDEPPWFGGTVPITTETPGLGALARLRLGGQQGTVRFDPFANFTGPFSGETLSLGGGLPSDTTYDKAKNLVGRIGFSPHPALDALASATGQTNRNPGPLSRTAPIEQAAELIPGMPTVRSAQEPFNRVKSVVTGRSVDDFDPVARRYAELVYAETGRPMSDNRNLEYLERMGDIEDPLWRKARQEVRLANLVGSLVSNLTPINQQAQGEGAARVSAGYASRMTDDEIAQLAVRDPDAARVALYERNIQDRFNPVTRTYQMANTADRDRAVIRNWGPFANNPAVRELLLESQRERYKRKDRP